MSQRFLESWRSLESESTLRYTTRLADLAEFINRNKCWRYATHPEMMRPGECASACRLESGYFAGTGCADAGGLAGLGVFQNDSISLILGKFLNLQMTNVIGKTKKLM